jgi:hypothetical protein
VRALSMVAMNSGSGTKPRTVLNPSRKAEPKPSFSTPLDLDDVTTTHHKLHKDLKSPVDAPVVHDHDSNTQLIELQQGNDELPNGTDLIIRGDHNTDINSDSQSISGQNQMLATQIKKMSQYSENKPHKKGNLDQRTKENKKKGIESVNRRP